MGIVYGSAMQAGGRIKAYGTPIAIDDCLTAFDKHAKLAYRRAGHGWSPATAAKGGEAVAEQNTVIPCWTPGDMMSQVWAFWSALASREFEGTPWTLETATYDIYRAVKITIALPDPTPLQTFWFPLMTLAETELAPVRYFTDSPGFQANVQSSAGADPAILPDQTFVWLQIAGTLIQTILEEWSNGAVLNNESFYETETVEDMLTALTAVQVYDAISEQVTVKQQGTMTVSTRFPATGVVENWYMSYRPASGAANAGAGVDLSSITQALQDIASQDQDVSINNGRALFSVRSRVITGP